MKKRIFFRTLPTAARRAALLAALALSWAGNAYPQPAAPPQPAKTQWGVKLGLNVSNITPADDKTYNNTTSKSGFHAGITLDYAFTPNWYLLTGLEYTTKGVVIDLSGRDLDINAAYIQLPLTAGFKLPVTNDFVAVLNLGPFFAYGLHGKATYGSSEYDTFGKDIAKNFDCGMLFGGGVEWQKFCFGLGFESGLVNIMQEKNTKSNSQNFFLSAGYKF